MKILQVVHSLPVFNRAGTEIYTHNLSLELSARHQIYIFSRICDLRQPEYEVKKETIAGLTVYTINNTFRDCDSFRMLYQNGTIESGFEDVLREVEPDVVHIQHLNYLSLGLIKKITERKIPAVLTLHDYWWMCPRNHLFKNDHRPCDKAVSGRFDRECGSCLNEMLMLKKSFKKIYNCIRKILPASILPALKKTYFSMMGLAHNRGNPVDRLQERIAYVKGLLGAIDIFIAPTEFIRKRYIEFGIPGEKIKLFPYGFNTGLFKGLEKKKKHKVRFAFIGTLLPAKGAHVLIKSFNGIKNENAQLIIYGSLRPFTGAEHYLPYLKKIVKNKNIMFGGGFDNQRIASVFQEIDALVVPSLWPENSPLVIQEAFLAKTPVIASGIGGIKEIVKDGINGFLTAAGDAGQLRERMQRIIDDPGLLEKFKSGIPEVKSIEDNAKEIEEVYSGLVFKNAEPVFINEIP